jgi:hypothetical protein
VVLLCDKRYGNPASWLAQLREDFAKAQGAGMEVEIWENGARVHIDYAEKRGEKRKRTTSQVAN